MADLITENESGRFKTRGGVLVPLCQAVYVNGKSTNCKCKNFAVKDSKFCYTHGGVPAKANVDTMNFHTGLASNARARFSTVGSKLLTRINELREDPDLFSLRDDAAYITALMDSRAEAAAEGVGIEQYNKIKDAYNMCKSSLYTPEFDDNFKALGNAITHTLSEYEASRDVLELIEKRAEIVETEQKLLHQKAYTLEVDQAFSLIMRVVDVVKANVRDVDDYNGVKAGIGKLLKVYEQNGDEIIDAEVIDGTEEPS